MGNHGDEAHIGLSDRDVLQAVRRQCRVCDHALIAILKILDGDSWTAFEEAGITGWRTEDERLAAFDLLIGILTDRLKFPPGQEMIESSRLTDLEDATQTA